jgi:uncharacterized protein
MPPVAIILSLVLLGTVVGTFAGIVGIGGGVLIIPALMLFYGFTQQRANGTSLAMLLPPIGIFAVVAYAKAGNIDWLFAAILATSFCVGGYIGGTLVNSGKVDPTALRVSFALLLVYVGGRLLFRPGGRARAAMEVLLMVLAFGLAYAVCRVLGRRWKSMPYWPGVYQRLQRDPFDHDYQI